MGVPTWMYRRTEDGSVEAQIFDSDALPEGWVDSPAKCVEAARQADEPIEQEQEQLKRRGRPKKGAQPSV